MTLVNRVNNVGVSVDFLKVITPTGDQENQAYTMQAKDMAIVLPFVVSTFAQLTYEEYAYGTKLSCCAVLTCIHIHTHTQTHTHRLANKHTD
jgi:hypothetical protein